MRTQNIINGGVESGERESMARKDLAQPDIDPNGIVAWNLRSARTLRGWTQAKAVDALDEYGI